MSPKMPQEHREFRRQQILNAAWECFAEKGYQETTIRVIAERMNLSTGIIYSYFKGKDDLLEAIHSCSIDNKKKVAEKIRQKDTAREAINELFNQFFKSYTMKELKKGVQADIRFWSEAVKRKNFKRLFISQYISMQKIITQSVHEGVKSGEFRSEFDLQVYVSFISALFLGLEVQLALIDKTAKVSYFEDIRKILLSNVWQDKKSVSDS
ncbi:MAG: TetR/AcrR family transcriptional regulator [Planctomycetes bacterium]|nr:TetR/AcrR family transcriptional regulator [Planctomycetota bacterium]